jgi:hypothetical protein
MTTYLRFLLPVPLLLACTADAPKQITPDDTAGEARDADGDGFDVAEGDCDDADASAFPGAAEQCDGRDQDCDGVIDEDVRATWYPDSDGDGTGDPEEGVVACEAPAGHIPTGTDCDDADASVYPLAPERCDGVDNDCDGDVDEDGRVVSYQDADGDGFGDEATRVEACDVPDGWVAIAGDCDDANADAWPGRAELCDEDDNDCDGLVDEDVTIVFWADVDGDGWGDAAAPVDACVVPEGYAASSGDCEDLDASIHPSASETCDDPVDRNCDGSVSYADVDGDGWAACSECDDASAAVNPAAAETCNGVDDDCDGAVDDADGSLDLASAGTWFADTDGDGFGDPATGTRACVAPAGWVADARDCDDVDAWVNPAAAETCNAIDDDCDGSVDEDAVDASTWYTDADGDGYGDPSSPVASCERGAGTVADARDCDDADAAELPGAIERQDGDDDDCDGSVDEAAVALVFAYECAASAGHPSLSASAVAAAEASALDTYLSELSLGMDRYDEPSGGWSASVATLDAYDLVVFSDCGWAWTSRQQPLVDALLAARSAGTATLMLGDDLGWLNSAVSGEEPLTLIGSTSSNGSAGQTVALTGASHPALSSPAGTPGSFTYTHDIDQCSSWGGGETVLMRASGGAPAWALYEDTGGTRAGMIPMSIYMANHGTMGAVAEANLEILFKNSVWWLLDL